MTSLVIILSLFAPKNVIDWQKNLITFHRISLAIIVANENATVFSSMYQTHNKAHGSSL